MPIDLGEITPILGKGTPAVAGSYLGQFGEELSRLGRTLGGMQDGYGQVQQNFIDAQIAKEVITAKDFVYTRINEFNKQLMDNPDYENYLDAWDSYRQNIEESSVPLLTLEQSKQKFADWYIPFKASQYVFVAEEVRKRAVGSAEASLEVSLQNAVRLGLEDAIPDYLKAAVASGIKTGDEAVTIAREMIPKARYNSVLKMFDNLNDADQATQLLLDPEIGDALKISPEQVKDMRIYFESKADALKKQTDKMTEQEGLKAWNEYIKKDMNDEFESINDRASYAARVDPSHREMVRQDVESLRKAYGMTPEKRIEIQQDVFGNHLLAQLWDWASNKDKDVDAPVTIDGLGQYLIGENGKPPKLRDSQLSTIRTAISESAKEHDKGMVSNEVSLLMSRLYGALDTNKNPALVVRIGEIDKKLSDGTITNPEHQSLLAKRLELQKVFEAGDGRTQEQAEYDAAGIIYDGSKTMMEKQKWLETNRKRFSGDDYKKWLNSIDVASGSQSRADIFKALSQFYDEAIRGAAGNEKRQRELTLQRYDAQVAMEKYMTQNPTNEKAWQDKLHQFQGDQAQRDMMEVLNESLGGAGFPISGMKAGRARELETARERGILAQYPKQAAEFETAYRPEALKQEQAALNRLKIKTTSHAQNALGDEEYLAADGSKYVVRQTNIKGKMVERVYEVSYRDVKDENGIMKRQIGYQIMAGQ